MGPPEWVARGLVFAASLLTGIALAGCPAVPEFRSEPGIAANSNAMVPQAAVVTFERTAPATTLIAMADDEHAWRLEYGSDRDPAGGPAVVGDETRDPGGPAR